MPRAPEYEKWISEHGADYIDYLETEIEALEQALQMAHENERTKIKAALGWGVL